MRISDWSSDVCSSDLLGGEEVGREADAAVVRPDEDSFFRRAPHHGLGIRAAKADVAGVAIGAGRRQNLHTKLVKAADQPLREGADRSEEHTSELQSLMRISYAVFCLKKKTQYHT